MDSYNKCRSVTWNVRVKKTCYNDFSSWNASLVITFGMKMLSIYSILTYLFKIVKAFISSNLHNMCLQGSKAWRKLDVYNRIPMHMPYMPLSTRNGIFGWHQRLKSMKNELVMHVIILNQMKINCSQCYEEFLMPRVTYEQPSVYIYPICIWGQIRLVHYCVHMLGCRRPISLRD